MTQEQARSRPLAFVARVIEAVAKVAGFMCGRAIKPVRPPKWHKSFHWSFLIRHIRHLSLSVIMKND